MEIASLFSGAGGLDLGFENGGFHIVYANEFDKKIWSTFEKNFPGGSGFLDRRSLTEVKPKDIPDCQGIIGGPPCQSWSEAGALRGIDDERGQLFFDLALIDVPLPIVNFVRKDLDHMLASFQWQYN